MNKSVKIQTPHFDSENFTSS